MVVSAALAGAAVSGRPTRSGVALVTGSTDGIGKLTARLLAQQEFTILLHGRSQQRLDMAREEILAAVPTARIETYCHDLSLLGGAEALAAEVLGKHSSLDVVVQNAGVFMQSRVVTSDELESTFAVNVAAPFILSKRLSPALQPGSRMLMVSSISQSDGGKLDLTSVQCPPAGDFDQYRAYGQSKRCMAMLSHELSLRASPERGGPVILSCDPGTVNTKMLLAGWGACGIPLEAATDEYELVKSCEPARHGKYFVGLRESRCHPDVYDAAKRGALWALLEAVTK